MLTLYYTPGACSIAPHIILEELQISYQAIKVDLKTHTAEGKDYYQINPLGSVPALRLENGKLVTQNLAILSYLADLKPELQLFPSTSSSAKIDGLEWLGFLNADVHKAFVPMLVPGAFVASDAAKAELKQQAEVNIKKKLDYLESRLVPNKFVLGDNFSIVDAYVFIFHVWTKFRNMSLAPWPKLTALIQRVEARPAVQQVLRKEDLLKS